METHPQGNNVYEARLRDTIIAAQRSGWETAIANVGEHFSKCAGATFSGLDVARIMYATLTGIGTAEVIAHGPPTKEDP